MKQRLFVQFLIVLMVGFLSAKLGAQVSVAPKKFVFVDSVGSPTPLAIHSSVFKVPAGVAIGPSAPGSTGGTVGPVYVADPQNNQVVAFLPDGSKKFFNSLPCPICTWFSPPPPWTLHGPTFVATDPNNGNVWISDTMNDVVVEVDPTGTVVAFAGAGPNRAAYTTVCGGNCPTHPNAGQGPGQFYGPGSLAVDKSGNVYVADGAGAYLLGQGYSIPNIRIQKFASNGTWSRTWGSWCNLNSPGSYEYGYYCNPFATGALGDGQLNYVTGLAVDDSFNVYAADQGNNRVQEFTSTGAFLRKWGGLPVGSGDGQFNQPAGIAVDLDHSVYVVDQGNNRIQQFDGSGTFLSKGGSKGTFEAQFDGPFGIAAVSPADAQPCFLANFFDPIHSDCIHGLVVSEIGLPGESVRNTRVQLLAARPDEDNDGITDEIDTSPNAFSNDFSNTSLGLGFTTSGSIVNRGDQTFAIYGVLSPSPQDEIRIRTETFVAPLSLGRPLTLTQCGTKITLSFPAGTGANIHCSPLPTIVVEEGPTIVGAGVGFQFVASDGTIATATLSTGDSLSVDVNASKIVNNASNFFGIVVVVGTKTYTLNQGQSINVNMATAFSGIVPPPPPPDFSLTANPIFSALRKLLGFRVTVTAINGFNGTVALSCSVPGCSLSPTSIVGSGTSYASGPNIVGALVTGTSGSLVHTADLTVPPPQPSCLPRTCQ